MSYLMNIQKFNVSELLESMWNLRGYDYFRQFRLITWTTLIGQFVHTVGGQGQGKEGQWDVLVFQ